MVINTQDFIFTLINNVLIISNKFDDGQKWKGDVYIYTYIYRYRYQYYVKYIITNIYSFKNYVFFILENFVYVCT